MSVSGYALCDVAQREIDVNAIETWMKAAVCNGSYSYANTIGQQAICQYTEYTRTQRVRACRAIYKNISIHFYSISTCVICE